MTEQSYLIPLMHEPFIKEDILALKSFLDENNIPQITHGKQTEAVERKFADWLGSRFAIATNSGSSANELTMLWVKYKYGDVSVVVPPLTWCSDWNSIIHAKLTPLTCDINLKNLSFDIDKLRKVLRPDTKVIFLTHVLGLNAITQELLDLVKEKDLILIEDCAETVGGTFNGIKLGNFGVAANWSGYAAHHYSGGEFGFVTTNDEELADFIRMGRSHSMLRESKRPEFIRKIQLENPSLNKDFIFISSGHNFRPTELTSTLLLSNLSRLDSNNKQRIENFDYFIKNLDSSKYYTDFDISGQCSYSLIVLLKDKSIKARDRMQQVLNENKIQFRQGLSGGGSQLKQPYLRGVIEINDEDFPVIEYVNNSSVYIGNYPGLECWKIDKLLSILNNINFE